MGIQAIYYRLNITSDIDCPEQTARVGAHIDKVLEYWFTVDSGKLQHKKQKLREGGKV